jgi:hypothetical protein
MPKVHERWDERGGMRVARGGPSATASGRLAVDLPLDGGNLVLIAIVRLVARRSAESLPGQGLGRHRRWAVDSKVIAPIFVVERNGDVAAYDSIVEACAAMESTDVEAGEYTAAFDAEGRALAVKVDSPTKRGRFLGLEWSQPTPAVIEALEERPSHQEELRSLLIAAMRIRGHAVESGIPLQDVVKSASKALARV